MRLCNFTRVQHSQSESMSGTFSMLRLTVAVVVAFAASAGAADEAGDAPRYAVKFDAAAQRADVTLCLRHPHAAVEFAADSAWAMRFASDVSRSEGRIEAVATGWRARDWRGGECLRYSADLRAIAAEHKPDVGWQLGADFIAAPQLWLLRPDVQAAADADLRIEIPAGWSVSAPWRELGDEDPKSSSTPAAGANAPAIRSKIIHFHIPNTPTDWSAAVAFGHFGEERIALPGGVLRLTILDGVAADDRAKLRAWLDRVGHAALSAYGRLPLAEVQVLMIPVGQRGGAVMFGQSIRGQGNALELLIDPSQPASEFDDDWMAIHELSHLMHPYLGDRGAWLSEGLATYYQNVLRGRSGLLTPAQAWDRLYEGFKRGARTPDDETLEQVAQNMHRSHAFQRVYWAGAAYWLTLDRDLRRETNGAMNLETALSRFRDCCLPAYHEWKPEDFVARLDTLAGTRLFSARYGEFAQMHQFPDWKTLYADLGIGFAGAHLTFADDGKGAAIRNAIMTSSANGAGAAQAASP